MNRRSDKLQGYEPLREVAPLVHVVDGEWFDSPLRRRMTVLRLRSGALLVHSAIRLNEEDYAGLDRLGQVAIIVVPNVFHLSDAHYYADRYPSAKVLAPRAAVRAAKKLGRVDGLLPHDWPPSLAEEVACIELRGTRFLGECLFVHEPSRTLIATDAVFNLRSEVRGPLRLFFEWNKIYRRFGASRIFQLVFLRNRDLLRSSIEQVLRHDFDRVIMSHGDILETGGKEALRASFGFTGVSEA